MLATANTGKIGRGFGKNAGEWTQRVETGKEEIPGSKRSMYGEHKASARMKLIEEYQVSDRFLNGIIITQSITTVKTEQQKFHQITSKR